jgi:hypothetical protein
VLLSIRQCTGTILWILGLLSYPSLVQAQMLSPRDFAHGQMALPSQEAAAYHFSMPLTVYQYTSHEDLSGLRMFNASRRDSDPFIAFAI